MSEKEYLVRLGERARKRHYHKTEKGNLVEFMVQLEVEANRGVWKPVIRYDCSHNFSHRDMYKIDGSKKKEEIYLTYTDALDFADKDINQNWDAYKNRFLGGEWP
ncbi:MAG: hypothetical protein AB1487_08315 [Thermodesulfobacteriota bacterium]